MTPPVDIAAELHELRLEIVQELRRVRSALLLVALVATIWLVIVNTP
jgi:hypothetical protein